MTKTRRRENNRQVRKIEILNHAVELAKSMGCVNLTGETVATAAGISRSLIGFYFGGIENLKREVVKFSIKHEILPVLSQVISINDVWSKSINARLKRKVIRYLNTQ